MLYLFLLISYTLANDRPVIGIFTLPSDESIYPSTEYSYIPASYVKQIESAGAMVIPISWQSSYSELEFLLESVNGILFTGGDTELYLNASSPGYTYNKFTDSASFLLMKAMIHNKEGKVLPIMGTCQGFQLIHYIVSQYYPVLSAVSDDIGKSRLLEILDQSVEMYSTMDSSLKEYLERVSGPYYSHHWGVLPGTYLKSSPLNSFFKITAVSRDAQGLEYVASAEAYDFPVYVYQFHSEKHAFEWQSLADHDPQHIKMGNHFASFFVSKARLSNNKFTDEELNKRSISNYVPVKMSPTDAFVQIYLFPHQKQFESQRVDRLFGISLFQGNQ